jgi:hypothetical protein
MNQWRARGNMFPNMATVRNGGTKQNGITCLQRATNYQEQYADSEQQSSALKPTLSSDNGIQTWISVQNLTTQQ